jgi:flagellar protein FliO/FliZ
VEDISLLELASRMVLSLVVVLGIMLLAAKVLKRRGLAGTRGAVTGRIEVLARQGLGRTSSVQLVRVGGKTLVLGVTDTNVSVLSEADPLLLEAELALQTQEQADAPAEPVTPGWGPLIEMLKERTVRHS